MVNRVPKARPRSNAVYSSAMMACTQGSTSASPIPDSAAHAEACTCDTVTAGRTPALGGGACTTRRSSLQRRAKDCGQPTRRMFQVACGGQTEMCSALGYTADAGFQTLARNSGRISA